MNTYFRSSLLRLTLLFLCILPGVISLHGQSDSLKIGLLVPGINFPEITQAAEQAIETANEAGGYYGIPFQLVIRSTEGPWGAGSKESVSLVFEDRVIAYIGWLDGRNAHLAEQVAAKSHLVYLETRASEPTLSQAYVPWFFRIIPNDNQQAKELVDRVGSAEISRVAILTDGSYDTRYAIKSMIQETARLSGAAPRVIETGPGSPGPADIAERLRNEKIRHLIVPFHSETSGDLIRLLNNNGSEIRIHRTLASVPGAETDKHGVHPEYITDAVLLLINAVQEGGPDREAVRKYLEDCRYKGITGTIEFDAMGNRKNFSAILP